MRQSDFLSITAISGALARRWRMALISSVGAVAAAAVWVNVFAAATFVPEPGLTGWVGRPALTSNDLTSGKEVIYRADYSRSEWTGRVVANYIDADGEINTDGPWTDTAKILENRNWNTGRKIVTRTASGVNAAFRWSSVGAAHQSALGSQDMLNYVRGDRSNEEPNGKKYRKREKIQGSIQHSSLLYWRHSNGKRRLYVGGNDGMLHVFDAEDGNEVFAYVPSMVVADLPWLAVTPVAPSFFVDGGLVMADVAFPAGNQTLLAGGLGGGGQGLFMLNVTDPDPANETDAAAMIKWEITPDSTGFSNLGYTYAAPRIGRLNNGTAAVVVGNGYMNSGSGKATLFLINADTGALIREIDTGSGSTGSPNGLSTPTLLDENQDGKVDYAFAGDIDGNLWRFDLRGTDTAVYSATKLMTTNPARAITSAPVVSKHPAGGYLVAFGTGRILTSADAADTAVHHVYGVWDGAPAANTNWLQQTLSEVSVSVAGNTQRMRSVTANLPNWSSGGHRGWRLTLTAGERVVGEGPMLSDGRLYLTTSNPTVAAASASLPAGETWLTEVDIRTGGGLAAPIFDVNRDGKIDNSDNHNGAILSGVFISAGVTSQAVLVDKVDFSTTLFNLQADFEYTPPPSTIGPGVSGGHFDLDFYALSVDKKGKAIYANIKHVHEYDDIYDVTGVNFLAASDSIFNLNTKLSATQDFKVLLVNQYLNPAMQVAVGSGNFVSVKTYGDQATVTSAASVLSKAATYNLNTVGTFMVKMPLDAFEAKDWWGDGGTHRSGLMPTQTGCVKDVGKDGSTSDPGKNGERFNGAFTVQIINASTPASALEQNFPGGGSKYGWRVKQSEFTKYVLAEYTLFWHHNNNHCYHDSGWVPNPPQDFSGGGGSKKKATGSSDPAEGHFGTTPPAGVTIKSTTVTTATAANGATTTITLITYSDGTTHKTQVTDNGDGTETVTITARDGATLTQTRVTSGLVDTAPDEVLERSGRINWREIFQE